MADHRTSETPADAKRVTGLVRLAAGAFVLLAVAWSTPLGQLSPDTKSDLYIDPVGFMARALHLWDPQVTWGVMQNQGYGYLFPMGPFFAVVGSVLPMWVAQRLWWSLLLLAGYLGMLWLLRELGIRGAWARHLGALAFALAPRVVTTLGGLSSEATPTLLVPLILAPLVAAARGRLPARRAAAFSGVAILGCGGINATATLLALVPAGVWLVTRARWSRNGLTWWWALAVVCATAWWAVPLVLLGRFSPPFLDWIENARMVASPIGLLDAVRGTTHWLGFLVTPQGPWWPAGFLLTAAPWVILATAVVAGLGVAGLSMRRMPHRGFLVTVFVIGVVVIALPHDGPLASPLSAQVQSLLDGPLSPFRNVHKADPLIRLPLTVGFAYGLSRLMARAGVRSGSVSQSRQRTAASALVGVVAVCLIWTASPALSGHLAPRGTFSEIPDHWREAADWLTRNAGADRALVVPAASFGEYTWGRPMDEPIRPLTDAPYAVRDAVPLTPANTIRFLDDIEHRVQSGRSLDSATRALARTGVRYLVLRNDLDTRASGAPSLMFAGSAIRETPTLRRVASFGGTARDIGGTRVAAVEIYEISDHVSEAAELWPLSQVRAASGASESLPAISALTPAPVVFDADGTAELGLSHRIDTDSYRAREAFFGVVRGADLSAVLTSKEDATAPDYRPWPNEQWRRALSVEGAASVTASSSIATDNTVLGLQPAYRPTAALDGASTTSWLTFGDERPTLDLEFGDPISPSGIRITPISNERLLGVDPGVPTRVRVVTDHGSVIHDLDPAKESQPAPGEGALTTHVRVEILGTNRGEPRTTLTGLTELTIPDVTVREHLDLGAVGAGRTDAVLLGEGAAGHRDGCLRTAERFRCLSGESRAAEDTGPMRRSVAVSGEGDFEISGTLTANPLDPAAGFLLGPDIAEVTASSVRAPGAASAGTAAFDLDARTAWSPAADDPAPRLTAVFQAPVTIGEIRLQTRDNWSSRYAAFFRVAVDGQERYVRLGADGRATFEPATGRRVSITLVREASSRGAVPSMEIEEVALAGVQRSKPFESGETECGEGPELRVNDVTFPTRLSATRDAALGFGAMTWSACVPVGLGFLPVDRVEVFGWEGTAPATTRIERVGAAPDAVQVGTPVENLERTVPSELTGRIVPGAARLLVTNDNTNSGWTATVGGTELTPITVDGFRQGFVVPEGAGGALSIRYDPDTTYRAALLLGLGLALALIPMALLTRRRGRQLPPAVSAVRSHAPAMISLALAGVVAGLPGLLIAGSWLLGVMLPVIRRFRPAILAGLIIAAAGAQVLAGPVGVSSWETEALTRALTLLAIVGCVAPSTWIRAPRDSDS